MTDKRLLRTNRSARILLYLAVAAGFLAAVCVAGQAWFLSVVVNRVFILRQTLDDVAAVSADHAAAGLAARD